ncbi:hypothetical protein ARMGADRAFT_284131 [Armillaria gallica]|uniref:Uncharacterized protein n=1 Tax=Armillaria gallica TaxID=47427 RepID=A0A2H3DHK9_ARMGA|nr:hypothetical protein ARMGADRAFT_284131 [Armillaria gallica]
MSYILLYHLYCNPSLRKARQQIFSHSYFKEVGLSFDQRDEKECLFPDWYPQEDVNQRTMEHAVRISNVTKLDIDRTIRSLVREFEESGAHHTLLQPLPEKERDQNCCFGLRSGVH